jgi:hypothetical protein
MSRPILAVRRSLSALVFATFLTKLAKHLALLVCLAILGQATGRAALGQLTILLLAVAASLIHGLGQTLKRRSAGEIRARQ